MSVKWCVRLAGGQACRDSGTAVGRPAGVWGGVVGLGLPGFMAWRVAMGLGLGWLRIQAARFTTFTTCAFGARGNMENRLLAL